LPTEPGRRRHQQIHARRLTPPARPAPVAPRPTPTKEIRPCNAGILYGNRPRPRAFAHGTTAATQVSMPGASTGATRPATVTDQCGVAPEPQMTFPARTGDTVLGELTHQRVDHFPGRFACDR
jgi:hypothetical protein